MSRSLIEYDRMAPLRGKTLVRTFVAVFGTLAALMGGLFLTGVLLPEQHRARAVLRLDRPPVVVWETIANLEASSDWRPGVDTVKRLPDRAGRPFYEETGRFGILRYSVEESDPPRRMVTRIVENADFGGTWTYELEPSGTGSVLTITEDGEIYNPVFRVVTRFVYGYEVTIRDYFAALEGALADAPGTVRTNSP